MKIVEAGIERAVVAIGRHLAATVVDGRIVPAPGFTLHKNAEGRDVLARQHAVVGQVTGQHTAEGAGSARLVVRGKDGQEVMTFYAPQGHRMDLDGDGMVVARLLTEPPLLPVKRV